jgi:beta-phosphoglucomutase-like phosphatase (HAD superfamily)
MQLEALIFDVDGTLAETEEAHRQSFNEAFADFGLGWVWDKELYRKLLQITGGKERLQYYIDHWRPSGSELACERFSGIYELSAARYAALVHAGAASPRPGVLRLIKEAHTRGVRLAIATTSARGSVDALLRVMLGEQGPSWFAVIAAGDIVEHKKPAPDVYRFAREKLKCDPRFCVAIEDSENGVKAARAAGLPVIAAPSYYLHGDDFTLAASVVSDLGEPEHPFRHIAGVRLDRDFADIDGLNGWLIRQQQASANARAGGIRY